MYETSITFEIKLIFSRVRQYTLCFGNPHGAMQSFNLDQMNIPPVLARFKKMLSLIQRNENPHRNVQISLLAFKTCNYFICRNIKSLKIWRQNKPTYHPRFHPLCIFTSKCCVFCSNVRGRSLRPRNLSKTQFVPMYRWSTKTTL